MPDALDSGRQARRTDHVPSATAASQIDSGEFIQCVLQIEPNLVVFDCDGTLWGADSGAGFFEWEIARGLIPPDVAAWAIRRYEAYHAGKVSEEDICAEMVTIHAGLPADALQRAAERFFDERIASQIFSEMRDLVDRLHDGGCEVWAVSSTNDWVVRAGVERFGIPADRVLAASVEVVEGFATDRLVRVPTGAMKADAIREVIGREVDAAFGNSVHDAAMLELARHAFAIAPSADLEALARERAWTIYIPDKLKVRS